MIRNRRGNGLMDAMVSIFLLGTAGIVVSASFPTGFGALRQSSEATKATAIAQKKIEQVRSLSYTTLTYENLRDAQFIDTFPMESEYSFTSRDSIDDPLTSGLISAEGHLKVEPQPDTEGKVLRIEVSVDWESANNKIPRNVTLTTLVADSTPRVKN